MVVQTITTRVVSSRTRLPFATPTSSTLTSKRSELPASSPQIMSDGSHMHATVGIALAAVALGLLALFTGYWFYRKSKQSNTINTHHGSPTSREFPAAAADDWPHMEMAHLESNVEVKTVTMVIEGNPVWEMHSPQAHELNADYSSQRPVELSAGAEHSVGSDVTIQKIPENRRGVRQHVEGPAHCA